MPTYPPCVNPSCKSHGQSHPNCACWDHMSAGGCVEDRSHDPGCSYYAEGGGVDFTPDSAPTTSSDSSDGLDFQPDDQTAARTARYGTAGQMAATAAEGASEGVGGPLGPMAEVGLGLSSKHDIRARAEENPISHAVGKAAGFVAGMASPFSQASVLAKAGELAGGLGLAGKLGVENALYAIGDEVSKHVLGNPDSMQTAIAKVGLSAALGAGTGAVLGKVSDAWTSKLGPKAEKFTKDFTDALKKASGRPVEATEAPSGSGIDPFTKKPLGTPLESTGEASQGPEATVPNTPGQRLADWVMTKADRMASEVVGRGMGGALGHATGIPGAGWFGAIYGQKAVKPLLDTIMPSIIKNVLSSESSGAGLKAAMDAVTAVASGDALIDQAAKGLFEMGSKAAVDLPDKERVKKLDEQVQELSKNPEGMLETGGDLGHYMPEHQAALSSTSQAAVNYLTAQKPQPIRAGVLDAEVPVSPAQRAAYDRTLSLAEQPLSMLHYLQKGTLRPKDVNDLKALYPALYQRIVPKVQEQMIDSLSKGVKVPLKMRMGLSLLTGQPVDSNLSSPSIMAAQQTFVQQPQPQPQQEGSKTKKSTSKLGKQSTMAATPAENRQLALQKA